MYKRCGRVPSHANVAPPRPNEALKRRGDTEFATAEHAIEPQCGRGRSPSVFDKAVDVMLCPMNTRRHLKHVGNAQERLLGVTVGHHLETKTDRFCRHLLRALEGWFRHLDWTVAK